MLKPETEVHQFHSTVGGSPFYETFYMTRPACKLMEHSLMQAAIEEKNDPVSLALIERAREVAFGMMGYSPAFGGDAEEDTLSYTAKISSAIVEEMRARCRV